jgi:rRNA biogenesis protein RRP5
LYRYDPARTRALLERATHLELNPKSMKFLFKRYLDFEVGGLYKL